MTQVQSDMVIAPPERFLHIADERLLQHFSAGTSEEEAGQLTALHALIEGLSSHEFSCQRKRMEADFASFFSGDSGLSVCSGKRPATAAPPGMCSSFSHPHQNDDTEVRFLSDLTALLHAAHYRLLTKSEWEAASESEFLLTLPVTCDWEALDDGLLRRFWATRRRQRQVRLLSDTVGLSTACCCRGCSSKRLSQLKFQLLTPMDAHAGAP